MMEGANGLRFHPKAPTALRPGDLVQVVGFPELGGPSPTLREAIVRPTGHSALPPARKLVDGALLRREYDATLVCVQARLVNLNYDRSDEVLDLQAGTRRVVARLAGGPKRWRSLPVGSLLELTGVYAGLGGDLASGRTFDSFELLLSSPASVRILQRPSWWTFQHTLSVMGAMALAMAAALVWITQLRHQVEERSRQLATAIHRQEQTERLRALEAERARVSQDLHDDLGAALTEIGLLGGLAQRPGAPPDRVRDHLGRITDKAREMVTTLDEIVWSLNPKHDSLLSLSRYFCEYAQQFLQLTPVRCRLEVIENLPDCPLTSDQRHHLLLAFKEALNNLVRHSCATEAHIGIEVRGGLLVVSLADDGQGLEGAPRPAGANGLDNLSRRLAQLGGRCEIFSQNGRGTRVCLILPLPEARQGSRA
jgi:signal transduction histidine kinase